MDKKERYLALDIFRGATVCLMITVNTPGEWGVQYGPLEHAEWHGFTLTDLVFPSFLFAVGNAMAFVMPKLKAAGSTSFWAKILKRSALIFLIGYLLSWFPFYNFSAGAFKVIGDTRILGVLQRIALCYLLAAALVFYFKARTVAITGGLILLAYWVFTWFLGGEDPYSISGFIGTRLDLWTLGESHMYHGEGVAFDPEGVWSTFPAVVNVLIGYLAGSFLVNSGHSYKTIALMLLGGVFLVFAALWWDLFFPINKKIWTSSFVLLTSGIDLLIVAVLIYILELREYRKWAYFFQVFGRNPLMIYVISILMIKLFWLIRIGDQTLQSAVYTPLKSVMPAAHASFLFAVSFMMVNWLIGYVMDKRRIYLKV